jgi:hypothetical protein
VTAALALAGNLGLGAGGPEGPASPGG